MASYLPPTEQLPIFDNEVFSTQNDPNATLTIAVANLLYLRKTFADTATAVETFQGGIKTTFLNGLSPIYNMEVCSNLTSGELYLGVDAGGTNGRSGFIHIGDATNLVAGAGVAINSGNTNPSSTNINTGTTSTGSVNILSGNTSNGNVNIKTGTGAGSINLGNTAGTQTITFNRPQTLGYIPSSITTGLASTQVGNRYEVVTNGTGSTSATANTNASIQTWNIPIGVWMFECSFFVNSGFINQFEYSIGTSATVTNFQTLNGAITTSAGGSQTRSSGVIVNSTAANPYFLVTKSATVSVPIINLYINLTRLA